MIDCYFKRVEETRSCVPSTGGVGHFDKQQTELHRGMLEVRKRGRMWGRDADWLLGCAKHMKERFNDEVATAQHPTIMGEDLPGASKSQLRPNWGNLPVVEEPIPSSAATDVAAKATEGETGMAAAAPPRSPIRKARPRQSSRTATAVSTALKLGGA